MILRSLPKSLLLAALMSCLAISAFSDTRKISDICEGAARDAAAESGVPLSVLRAISLTETGRKSDGQFQPWPWTVNMEGVGKWFDTYDEAKKYVDRHFERGARSFDVGCFQINYRWHHQAFTSVEHMFEPLENARYAARFLSELYDEFGSWPKAAGAYHSRTPKYAKKYVARFNRIRKNLSPPRPAEFVALQQDRQQSAPTRVNKFPLLRQGGQGQMASLVPLGQTANARIIDINDSRARPVN